MSFARERCMQVERRSLRTTDIRAFLGGAGITTEDVG